MSGRSGTEVVVEQLADGLRRRGHHPAIYAPQLGPLAQQMRERGHVVTRNPASLPWRPDIIHAHHTGPAMAALVAVPGVPAVFVCHDASAAFDTLPPHPRVRRILAVDERCRARLVTEGADAGQVGLLFNAVDLERIPPRLPLPPRPARAVVLVKQASLLPALRQACALAGVTLEEYGAAVGRLVERPEALFASADLVFATGRGALEAAAAGAGVVVCDARGCAGFMGQAQAEAWLPWNLGAGILVQPPDVAQLGAAIAAWSAPEAAAVSALVRAHRGIEPMLDHLLGLYAEMLKEPMVNDPQAEAAAVAGFISGWVPNFDLNAPWRSLAEQVSQPHLASPLGQVAAGVAELGRKLDDLAAWQLQQEQRREQVAAMPPARWLWRRLIPRPLRAALSRVWRRLGLAGPS